MADTTFIKKEIEPYVRKWLAGKFPGHWFDEKSVFVGESTEHKFDAVAKDGTIVGDILTNRARTRTGRENTGAVRKACNDVELLNKLPLGIQRVLVFTDGDFCDLLKSVPTAMGWAKLKYWYVAFRIISNVNSRESWMMPAQSSAQPMTVIDVLQALTNRSSS